ncbi:glycosyltransferase family 2 protein [Homoserinimonas sp. OAct 916]|uniref:glycosyltransferase family 2 protein n=1 Tax=Homoserinimonas sp. OAct 916 TaxID=2211450 RepID=UPI0013002217|nr:glycosyltransferase family 2 protein [Homoserinimonas sp. OAct 916]
MSVILPFYNVEGYLAESLASIVNQTLRDIEVILVDDGSTDGSAAIAAELANRDPRVKVLTQANSGPGAARNAGVARARGQYVSFVDSDDRLPRDALAVLVRSARSNDADIVVGALSRFDSTRKWVPAWAKGVHSISRQGITLREFPALLRNNYPVGKVYRREFWNQQGLKFRIGVIYEDQPLIAQMLNRASCLNVLTDVTYEYRRREDRSSISQRPEELADLIDRVAAWDLSLETLRAEASSEVLEGWYDTIYGTHLHWYLNNDSIADAEYFQILRSVLQRLREHELSGALVRVSPEKRVALLLLDLGLSGQLNSFREGGGYELSNFPATVSPSGVVHSLPLTEATLNTLPSDVLLTRPDQMTLRQQLVRGAWVGDQTDLTLRLSGSASIPGVDQKLQPNRVEVLATNRSNGAVTHAVVRQSDEPALVPSKAAGSANTVGRGYVAEFRIHDLVSRLSDPSEWTLDVRVSAGGLSITEALGNISSRGALTEMGSRMVGQGLRLRFVTNPNRHVGAKLLLERPACIVGNVLLDERQIRVTFRSTDNRQFVKMIFRADSFETKHVTRVSKLADGQLEAVADLPFLAEQDSTAKSVSWTVRVEDVAGNQAALSWAEGRTHSVPAGTGTLRAYGAATGNLKLEEYPQGCIFLDAVTSDAPRSLGFSGNVILPPQTTIVGAHVAGLATHATVTKSEQNWSVRLDISDQMSSWTVSSDGELEVALLAARGGKAEPHSVPVVLGAQALRDLPLPIRDTDLLAVRRSGRTLCLKKLT